MIVHRPIEPTADDAAVIVAHEVTPDGRLVTVTTFRMLGCPDEVRRDVHSAEWSADLAARILRAVRP